MAKITFVSLLFCNLLFAYSGGSGSPADPYVIATSADLTSLSNDTANFSSDFVLSADLDMSGISFKPIGNSTKPFTGNFYGQGHYLIGLNVSGTAYSAMGLFGVIDQDCIIRDISIYNSTITVTGGNWVYAGILVGINSGFVINCRTDGTVSISGTTAYAGGIAGDNTHYGVLSESSFSGSVYSNNVSGGVAGINDGLIDQCGANATVIARNNAAGFVYAGGIAGIGDVDSTIQLSSTTGVIDASVSIASKNTVAYAGGLVGMLNQYASIIKCGTDANVSADAYGVSASAFGGGAVGISNNDSIVSYSFAKSYVSATAEGTSGYGYAGGFFGQNSGNVNDCFATGDCYSDAIGSPDVAYAGGFWGNNSGGTLTRCYSTGSPVGDADSTGGFGGRIQTGTLATACFWDSQASGIINAIGRNAGGTYTIYSRTTEQMTTASTYTQEGWDFSSVWGIEETVSYPELIDATLPYKPKVDLIITDISVSGSDIHSAPGQSTTITVAVENVGDLSLSSAARIKAYYSTTVPENWEQVTTYAGYVKLSSLAQGTSTSIQITFNMPSVSGDVYFCVKADSELAVSEYSEDNNWSGVLGRAVVSFAGGAGTTSQPFLIADNTQLKSIANATLLYDKAYKLVGDIDMAGEQFDNSIISANQAGTTEKNAIPFTGTFDGAGHTIHNYDIYAPFTYYVGLFGVLGQGATVSDLHLRNFTVVGRRGRYFGAIAGESSAEITRCSISSGTIDGGQYSSYVGGLVGQISGDGASISDSYVANVDKIAGSVYVGGLCGNALENTSIEGCYVATQGITDSNYTGPIAGSVWGMSITGTYWDSDITIAGDDLTTLAVGRNEASTIEAYSKTTQEMMDKSTFTGWQWDTLWAISSGEYPVILANVDLNNDSMVNLQDLAVMSEMWLYQGVSVADLNRDQSVDMVDFSILADKLE